MNEIKLPSLKIKISPDDVIRAQGADPTAIRERRPALVHIAEKARDLALELCVPNVISSVDSVKQISHRKILLERGYSFRSENLCQYLAGAEQIVVIICTIGGLLDEKVKELSTSDLVMGLALDAAGGAAVENLANQVCMQLEKQADAEGLRTTTPINPGIEGWSVEEGQPQIFGVFKNEDIPVILTEANLMIPQKSVSFLVGIGSAVNSDSSVCDFCSLRERCTYKKYHQSKGE